jgi:hypothetical protein
MSDRDDDDDDNFIGGDGGVGSWKETEEESHEFTEDSLHEVL